MNDDIGVSNESQNQEEQVPPMEHTDLDDLIGSWEEDPAFDRVIAEFERIEV